MKGSHSSASSAEARSTDLPQKRGQVNSSRWASTQGTEGRCSARDSGTAQHCPALHILCCPGLGALSPMGKAVLVHCPVGLLEQE